MFCSVTASYSHLPPIIDRFRTEHSKVDIKLTTGDGANAIEIVQEGKADLAIADHPESLPASIDFTPLMLIPLRLIAPALPCPVRNQVTQEKPKWAQIPFILPNQVAVRQSINLWFRRHSISNPHIYATVSGHEAIVSMVALGCGVALLPDMVLVNSPELVRNRVLTLENMESIAPLVLGVCVQKNALKNRLFMHSGISYNYCY